MLELAIPAHSHVCNLLTRTIWNDFNEIVYVKIPIVFYGVLHVPPIRSAMFCFLLVCYHSKLLEKHSLILKNLEFSEGNVKFSLVFKS